MLGKRVGYRLRVGEHQAAFPASFDGNGNSLSFAGIHALRGTESHPQHREPVGAAHIAPVDGFEVVTHRLRLDPCRHLGASGQDQTLNLKWRTSPSFTTYSLPSCRSLP